MTIARKGTPVWRIHPGEVLWQEFMMPENITIYRLAKELRVSDPTVRNIVQSKAAISPEMASRLARFFGTTEQFWLNLQGAFDINRVKSKMRSELERIHPLTRAKGLDRFEETH